MYFTHGLMADPTPLIHYVYQVCVERNIAGIRSYYPIMFHHVDKLFNSFHAEAKVKIPGRPYHNQYLNYDGQSHDPTGVFSPSKLYWFEKFSKDCHRMGTQKGIQEGKSDCVIYIGRQARLIPGTLLDTCKKISRDQIITQLCVEDQNLDDIMENDVFTLNQNTQSVNFLKCSLPFGLTNHVFSQLRSCTSLVSLRLSNSTLDNVTNLDLTRMGSLKVLNLYNSQVSERLIENLCKQLKPLVHMEELDLSYTPVGSSCRYITEAIEAWGSDPPLGTLYLEACHIPTQMCVSLVESITKCEKLITFDLSKNDDQSDTTLDDVGTMAHGSQELFPIIEIFRVPGLKMPARMCNEILLRLSNCQHLSQLDLSGNTLTACLCNIEPHSELASLLRLDLNSAQLDEDDVLHIKHLVDGDKLPKLGCLNMWDNNLGRFEDSIVEFIHACGSHAERNLESKMTLSLVRNNFNPEFSFKWLPQLPFRKTIPSMRKSLNLNLSID